MDNKDVSVENLRENLKKSPLYSVLRPIVRALRKLNRPTRFNVYHRDISDIKDRLLFNPDLKVLDLGCGNHKTGAHIVGMDMNCSDASNVVADAHRIPFGDDCFDVVWFQAVLEHLRNPEQAVNEINRVMKQGGRLYCEIPFFQGMHDVPNDYQRYTIPGLKRVFGNFEDINISVVSGPASAMSVVLRHFLSVVFSFNTRFLYDFFYGYVFSYLTFWIKYFDVLLLNNVNSEILCFGYSVLCRKKEG